MRKDLVRPGRNHPEIGGLSDISRCSGTQLENVEGAKNRRKDSHCKRGGEVLLNKKRQTVFLLVEAVNCKEGDLRKAQVRGRGLGGVGPKRKDRSM